MIGVDEVNKKLKKRIEILETEIGRIREIVGAGESTSTSHAVKLLHEAFTESNLKASKLDRIKSMLMVIFNNE